MPASDAGEDAGLPIDRPERAELPSQRFADGLQNARRGVGKRGGFGKYARGSIGRRQVAPVLFEFCYLQLETSCFIHVVNAETTRELYHRGRNAIYCRR
jgi:hypothetical protein